MTNKNEPAPETAPEVEPEKILAEPNIPATNEPTPIESLIARMDAHEVEGAEIDKAMAALKLDKKGVKAIRKARDQAAAAKKTLDALMGLEGGA